MNNKGFMMAEVVVVASIVLVTLVGFYTSYNKIISIYNQRVDYYDVATLYKLAKVRDENFYSLCYKYNGSDDCYEDVDGELGTGVYYVPNGYELSSIDASNQTFKDYLSYLENSESKFDGGTVQVTDGVLIMENCYVNNNYDNNNCKYAYLEVDFDASMS